MRGMLSKTEEGKLSTQGIEAAIILVDFFPCTLRYYDDDERSPVSSSFVSSFLHDLINALNQTVGGLQSFPFFFYSLQIADYDDVCV
jgi:hypothetical protein